MCPQAERVIDLGVRLGRLGPNAFFGERAVLTRGATFIEHLPVPLCLSGQFAVYVLVPRAT